MKILESEVAMSKCVFAGPTVRILQVHTHGT